ncbi:diguanylate cyclase [Desulfosporosinus sp. Sb-LF]|nr:diguanylate cyclase [Desulfosporosinus sp. Sb-LF]
MFSIWMFSTICLVIAISSAQLLSGMDDLKYILNRIYIFRICIQILLLLATYYFISKPYKMILNKVSNKTISFMSLYPILAFLLLINNYTISFERLKRFNSTWDMLLFLVFIIIGYVFVFAGISSASQIISLQYNMEKLEWVSYTDPLTGLFNRRFYEDELKRLDTERNLPMTIVMADVNGLKLINDSFGHVMGDELLKKVAEVIKKGCRADDIIARLGGDEFVIILPKTDAFETEKIIKRIKDLSLKEKVGSVDISISIGYETKNNEEENNQEIFKKAEDHMYKKKLFESPSMRGKTMSAIINTLHEKNKREEAHSHRVSALCKSMGEVLGMPEHDIEELKTVGLLHDIGKIAINENILNKTGNLTDDEWKEIKRHPEIGYRILSTVNDMSDMANYVLYHHERWDGKGYPKGLKGEEIPFVSRIITVADAYDAMTSERSYRGALPNELVIAELQRNAGIQFDPELARIFIEKVLGKISG